MTKKSWNSDKQTFSADINDVYRVLEVGKILRSVLSQQELEQLQKLVVDQQQYSTRQTSSSQINHQAEIGNTGVT